LKDGLKPVMNLKDEGTNFNEGFTSSGFVGRRRLRAEDRMLLVYRRFRKLRIIGFIARLKIGTVEEFRFIRKNWE
jgi:hypothetical protein